MIITCFLALTVAVAQGPTTVQMPARKSRAAFCRAMKQIGEEWTKAQVWEVLGKPDDVWNFDDLWKFDGLRDKYFKHREEWRYGTNGHGTTATLGTVHFDSGKVLYTTGGDGTPPPTSTISEADLSDALRVMASPLPYPAEPSFATPSLRLLRMSNCLIRQGRAKALAILGEYDRALGIFPSDLFSVVRVVFTSKRPGGVFPYPNLGVISPDAPKDLRRWPTYPVVIADDVPVCLIAGITIGGAALPFRYYLEENKADWVIRGTELCPPSDPFLVFEKIMRVRRASGPRVYDASGQESSVTETRFSILELVATAYRPRDAGLESWSFSAADFSRCHREFLALGCRWDSERQMYVRRDGSILPEPDPPVASLQPEGVLR